METKGKPEVQVVMNKNQPVTTSRNVAETFGKNHRHVLEAVDNLKEGVAENWADLFHETTYVHEQNKQLYREVLMTRDGFSILAMGFTGKKAIQFKLAYIDQFNKMERHLIESSKDSYMIDDPVQRAERWIQERKVTQQLTMENQEMKPKAFFADSVSASKESILIRDLSRFLKQNGMDIGQNRLFEKLRQEGYLIKKGSSKNRPTQRAMDLGLFSLKETVINRSDGTQTISITTKVTGKGQYYFINKYLKEEEENAVNRNQQFV